MKKALFYISFVFWCMYRFLHNMVIGIRTDRNYVWANQFTLNTENFQTTPDWMEWWIVVRGNFTKWDMVYASIQRK
jgi:hypothetical protein